MQHQTTPLPDSRDVIKAAVRLAGGVEAVAATFGVTAAAVNAWRNRGTMPGQYVRALSAKGGGIVTVDALLAAIERTAADRVAA
jgi:hypothetical protein